MHTAVAGGQEGKRRPSEKLGQHLFEEIVS